MVPVILDGLRRLEYRGYDSAGIAVGSNGNGLELRRAPGKLRNLEEVIRQQPIHGSYGIGHTRWATHGRPTEENAHPHRDCSGRIVVVHNGIVENYLALKRELIAEGHIFVTETDTEIIAHLIEQEIRSAAASGKTLSLEDGVRRAVRGLTGAFALSAICADEPNKIVVARNGPPAVVGLGNDEYFVASDVPGILHHTRNMYFLEDGDMAVLRAACEVTGDICPPYRYACSLQIARRLYDLESYRLPSVAAAAGFTGFAHHDAAADALACAHIMIDAARRTGTDDIAHLADAAGVDMRRIPAPALFAA